MEYNLVDAKDHVAMANDHHVMTKCHAWHTLCSILFSDEVLMGKDYKLSLLWVLCVT